MDIELINKKLAENIPLTDEEQTFLATNAQDGNFLKLPIPEQPIQPIAEPVQNEPLIPAMTPAIQEPSLFDRVSNKYQDLSKEQNLEPKLSQVQPASLPKLPIPASPKPFDLSSLYGQELGDKALSDAIQNRDQMQLITGLIKAGTQIASPGKPNLEGIEAIEKQAIQPVEDITLKRKAKLDEMNVKKQMAEFASQEDLENPDSEISKFVRNVLARSNFHVPKVSAAQLKRAGLDIDKIITQQIKPIKETLTEAEKMIDKEFGKDYNEFFMRGGYADVQKGLQQLSEVSSKLKTGNYTGPITGRIPNFIQAFINPKSIEAREAVEEIVQRNLRPVLGAQFTEKEGERLIARAYNPSLSEEENIKRVDRLTKQIKLAFDAKVKAGDYYKEHGTLKGFTGPVVSNISSADQFENEFKLDSNKQKDPQIEKYAQDNKLNYNKAEQILRNRGYGK